MVHEKRAAHDALEKRHRAQERVGVPLVSSPSTQDNNDGDDEGMEVRLGFSPEVSLWSESSSASLFAGLHVSVLGLEASAPLLEM